MVVMTIYHKNDSALLRVTESACRPKGGKYGEL
nr:MAG TPA: hypothetical protein [Caudoviricetes sp.]